MENWNIRHNPPANSRGLDLYPKAMEPLRRMRFCTVEQVNAAVKWYVGKITRNRSSESTCSLPQIWDKVDRMARTYTEGMKCSFSPK
jgi:hypothetical protein